MISAIDELVDDVLRHAPAAMAQNGDTEAPTSSGLLGGLFSRRSKRAEDSSDTQPSRPDGADGDEDRAPPADSADSPAPEPEQAPPQARLVVLPHPPNTDPVDSPAPDGPTAPPAGDPSPRPSGASGEEGMSLDALPPPTVADDDHEPVRRRRRRR